MNLGPRIDYKGLRRVNPEAARMAVIEYLKTNGGNIADTARVFGIQRPVVYDILKKEKEGNLKDRPTGFLTTRPTRHQLRLKRRLLRLKTRLD